MRSVRLLTVAVIALLAAGAVFAVVYVVTTASDESAGRDDGTTLRMVMDDPQRYEGERVIVSGEWAENDFFPADRAEEVIVIGDDADVTLLAIPQLGVTVPPVDENDVLRITGEVRIPEGTEAGFLDAGGLLTDDRDGAEPVIAATRVERGTLGDPDERFPVDVTVEQLVGSPRAFDERPLRVRGVARQLGGRGFVLTDDDASIFVSAPTTELEQVQDGERISIRADLSRLSRYGEDALGEALADDPAGAQPDAQLDLEALPIEAGEPYLLLRSLEAGDPARDDDTS